MGWILAIKALCLVVCCTQAVPFMVWMERKLGAFIQDRPGPERASAFGLRFAGLFHIVADVGKMLTKEDLVPARADRFAYVLAPMIPLVVVLTSAAVLPLADTWQAAGYADVPLQVARLDGVGILFVFAVSSLSVYGIILAGWASRSRFPLMGALRSAAQLVSYELPLGLAALTIPLIFGTLEPNALVQAQGASVGALAGESVPALAWVPLPAWGIVVQPVAFLIFLAATFAETNRLPFDLPEGESEIVGFHAEYSSMSFGMFFMAEYIHVVVAAALAATLFLGGWQVPGASTAVLRAHAGGVLAGLGVLAIAAGAVAWWWSARLHRRLGTRRERGVLVGIGVVLVGAGATACVVGPGWTPGAPAAATLAAVAQAASLGVKVLALAVFFIWVRWTLPRFRYDQVMRLGWKQLLPLALLNLVVTAGVLAAAQAWGAR